MLRFVSISAYFCITFIRITFVRLLSKRLISLSQVEVVKPDIIIIIIKQIRNRSVFLFYNYIFYISYN